MPGFQFRTSHCLRPTKKHSLHVKDVSECGRSISPHARKYLWSGVWYRVYPEYWERRARRRICRTVSDSYPVTTELFFGSWGQRPIIEWRAPHLGRLFSRKTKWRTKLPEGFACPFLFNGPISTERGRTDPCPSLRFFPKGGGRGLYTGYPFLMPLPPITWRHYCPLHA